MAMLTSELVRDKTEPKMILSKVVKSGETIYQGAFVCEKTDGYAYPAKDAVGYSRCLGVARETVVGDGTKEVEIDAGIIVEATSTGLAVTDVGKTVYIADDQTVKKTASHYIEAGVITKYISSTKCEIYIPLPENKPVQVAQIHHDAQITGVDKFKLFVAPKDLTVLEIGIVAGAYAGTPASNHFDVNINNVTTSKTLISSDKSLETATANEWFDLGVDQNLEMSEDDVLEFEITAETGTATIDDLLIVVKYRER